MNRASWVLIVFTSLLFMFGLFIGYNEGKRVGVERCTNPIVIMHYVGGPGVKPYTVYKCNEGLRAFYDDEHEVLRESKVVGVFR
jgi:hypothetical protein